MGILQIEEEAARARNILQITSETLFNEGKISTNTYNTLKSNIGRTYINVNEILLYLVEHEKTHEYYQDGVRYSVKITKTKIT